MLTVTSRTLPHVLCYIQTSLVARPQVHMWNWIMSSCLKTWYIPDGYGSHSGLFSNQNHIHKKTTSELDSNTMNSLHHAINIVGELRDTAEGAIIYDLHTFSSLLLHLSKLNCVAWSIISTHKSHLGPSKVPIKIG